MERQQMLKQKLSWKYCVGIYTDAALSMIGSIKGFTTLVKMENVNVISTHCFLHRESLVSKTLRIDLKHVSGQIIEMIN